MWIYLLVLLLATAVENRVRFDCACGESKVQSFSRIINGDEAEPFKYPWMTAMLSPTGNQVCSGTILSDRMIVTAGHCIFYTEKPIEILWMVEVHSVARAKAKPKNIYRTSSYKLHPKFKPEQLYDDYDLSLVTVDRPIQFTDKASPICLPRTLEHIYFFNKKVIVAGWGKIYASNESPISDVLMETTLRLKTPQTCKLMTALPGYNERSMICAHEYHTDACLGDSGGPLFVESAPNRYILLGVISFGEGCATSFPGIYAKIDEPETLKWIKKSLKGDVCYDSENHPFLDGIKYNRN